MDKTFNHSILTSFWVILFVSCSVAAQSDVQEVSADELKELVTGDVLLLDVRTPGEYNDGRIKGSTLIDFRSANFDSEIAKLDSSKPVVVYCAAGGRSTRASDKLKEAGFTKIYNYTGGFNDWRGRGEEIEKE